MYASNPRPDPRSGSGYLDQRRTHLGLLVSAVAIHIGIVGAILSYNPELVGIAPKPIELIPIAKTLPPKPVERVKPKTPAKADPQPERGPIVIELPRDPVAPAWPQFPPQLPTPPEGGTGSGTGTGTAEPAPPVLVPAIIDGRYARDLQPPYPPALERLEIEGSVTVRVQIGPDGRVTAVELVRAEDPAFFASTRDWALRKWRFKPATRDGNPVASVVVKTVQFRISR